MIKRWDINEPHVELSEWDNGDFVWYTDYQKLEAENERLRQALEHVGTAVMGMKTSQEKAYALEVINVVLEVSDD